MGKARRRPNPKDYEPPKVVKASKPKGPQMCVRCGCDSGSSSGGI